MHARNCGLALLLAAIAAGPAAAGGLQLRVPGLAGGAAVLPAQVYDGDGCRGGNRSPALAWSGVPPAARSLAVTMFDPDAPRGGWWHWLAYDLPPRLPGLGEGAATTLPAGARQARNDYGEPGYSGPCPPPGRRHHYLLTLYALDVSRLPVNDDSRPAAVMQALRAHAVGTASLTLIYGR
ncbi:MAG: YbhB/YbcL family Raf kinase inhibitor-like protein [Gammaproteobacteria bacterium]|nr:YbhB/YbcL family Raf kinase inhibitor-like protein [Gammaproteobacteria bacterium]